MQKLSPYLFVEISKKIAEKKAKGEEVISFGIGDPDIPTPSYIIEELCKTAQDSTNHRYPDSDGMPEVRRTISDWYRNRFGVSLDPEKEILPLIGSKEGIAHIALCFIDPGDIALVPDPGYPVYSIGTMLAGGESFYLPLLEKNNFLPDLESIPPHILKKAQLLWISYPNNPTAAIANLDFFDKVVIFARKNGLVVCHDAAYTEVAYDDYKPISFMQATDAKEIGVEFHSWSKTYNMTGWRIGMLVGNERMIKAMKDIKSNIDSGIPQAIQKMAIKAMISSQESVQKHNATYQRRRDLIIEALKKIGIEAKPPKASLYIWAKVPEGYTSVEFATELLDKVGVVVIPGVGYGESGEGYVRLSMTISDATLVKGLSKLTKWRNQKGANPYKQ